MLSYTGERVIPKMMSPKNGLVREHKSRYEFASERIWGRVLDIACGSGYGSEILLTGKSKWLIHEYVGVDIDPETIQYARSHYSCSKTKFLLGDGLDPLLSQRLGVFDCILSFETIEHLEEDRKFLANLKSLLAPNGLLILSTPLGQGRDFPTSNPFHVFQYRLEEFRELLSHTFTNTEIFLQKDLTIEKPIPQKKYYLAIAVCSSM